VPIRTLNAGHNPKYFGVVRGVTYYNFSSDQFTGFHAIVIPGTLRDSLFILDGVRNSRRASVQSNSWPTPPAAAMSCSGCPGYSAISSAAACRQR
jgi:hypothetical protein